MDRALERLSSGLRINHAGDDAAGLAIANGLDAQIRGLTQAARNSNDGLSLIGTAEGAIGTATEILQRIRELAVQSANDINSTTNRQDIQKEIDAQIEELTRIGNTVEFNGSLLLNGTFSSKKIQVGAMAGQTISISLSDFRSSSIGTIATTTGTVAIDTAEVIDGSDTGANSVVINSTAVGASAGLDTISTTNVDGSAIAKAAAINAATAQTGVKASVNAAVLTGAAITGGTTTTQELAINNVTVVDASNTITTLAGDSNGVLRARINAVSNQTGVVATIDATNKIVLTAADGRNIHVDVTGSGAGITGLTADSVTAGTITLTGHEAFSVVSGATDLIGMSATSISVALDASTSVSQIDVTSQSGAETAIQIIDSALEEASNQRSELGAITNRLENTISNIEVTIENLSASESRIRDADFAVETANLTRAQILQQAGVAVLTQANLTPQAALTLLGA
jgi:flagellin